MEKYYTMEELASILRCKVRTTREWARKGTINATKTPGAKVWVVSESEVQRLLSEGKNAKK